MLNISDCQRCSLHQNRTQVIVGEGPEFADVMIVGECPGPDEDKQGRPFIGKTGRLLREVLDSLGINSNEIFITNIVKCYPFHKLNPNPEHVQACSIYIQQQIQEIVPKLIVSLGRYSSEYFIGNKIKITKESGRIRQIDGRFLLPILHPSYVLRGNMKPADYALAFLPILDYMP